MANRCIGALNRLWGGNLRTPLSEGQPKLDLDATKRACMDNILRHCRQACRRGIIPRAAPGFYNPFSAHFTYLFNYEWTGTGGWCRLKSPRAALPNPGTGATVDILPHLPQKLHDLYSTPDGGIVRSNPPLLAVVETFPLVFGVQHGHYEPLLRRMDLSGMVEFQDHAPIVTNGLFGVQKDKTADRVIFDGRRCNMFFHPPEPVQLPSPSGLSDLLLPAGATLYVAKTDMDNQFHRLRSPVWLRQYFGLPRVRSSAVGLPGPERWVHPVLKTLPMGWAHSVILAQAVHESLVDASSASARLTRIPYSATATPIGPAGHVQYIDDFLAFRTDKDQVNDAVDRVVETTGANGLPARPSKVQRVEKGYTGCTGLGIDFNSAGTAFPTADKFCKLIQRTRAILRTPSATGTRMAQLIGSWVWVCLLRRPCLSLFSACYEFIQEAGPFVRAVPGAALAELRTAVQLAPLIAADLSTPFSGTVLASDASSRGGGVTYTSMTPDEARFMADEHAGAGWYTSLDPAHKPTGKPTMAPDKVSRVDQAKWKTAIATRWKHASHINVLEAQAVVLALRWYISSRRHLHTRVPVLVDSSAVVGALAKGRSSSRRLLRQCRRVAALCLASDIRPYYVWVPTDHNPADGPSRK